jgi:hypothetical protein
MASFVQCTHGVWHDKYNITGDEPNDQDLYNILINKNTDKYSYIIMSSAYEDYFGKNTLCRIFQTQKRPYVMAFGHHYIWPSMSIKILFRRIFLLQIISSVCINN